MFDSRPYGIQNEISANVTAGTQYYLAVDGAGTDEGDLTLNDDFTFPLITTIGPKATWTRHYDNANFYYKYFASRGDANTGLAYWFYFRAYGDQAYYMARRHPGYAQFNFYQGLGYFYYTFYKATSPNLGAYFLYLYFAYAYYDYFNAAGDAASAGSYFGTCYALALSAL